jgi:hypothetical protein
MKIVFVFFDMNPIQLFLKQKVKTKKKSSCKINMPERPIAGK